MKIWAKMDKISKYFEKGQMIVCNNHTQQTARIGLDNIRFIRLSNNLINFSNPSYFTVTIISNVFSVSRSSFDHMNWQPSIFPSPSLSLFLCLWQVQFGMSSMGMAVYSWPQQAKNSSINATFHYSTLNDTCQKILETNWC